MPGLPLKRESRREESDQEEGRIVPDAFWANLPTLVISCGTFLGLVIAAIAQYKVNTRINDKLEVVAKATDGLADKMAQAKLQQGTAEGKVAGIQQERQESRDRVGMVKSNDRRGSSIKSAPDKVLEKIEQHTKETAENTSRTEAKVDDLKK